MTGKIRPGIIGFSVIALTGLLLASGCGAKSADPVSPAAAPAAASTSTAAEKKPLISEKTVAWKADGVINDNEYSKVQTVGELEVYSRIDGDTVRLALKAKTNGFVAIGFDPAQRMNEADIIIGYVKDGKAFVADMFSIGPTGPHPPDDQQGGRNDVTVFGGSKKDGVTIIELERKLVTGDPRDKAIKTGDNKIIWAIGDAETFTGRHVKRGAGVLKL